MKTENIRLQDMTNSALIAYAEAISGANENTVLGQIIARLKKREDEEKRSNLVEKLKESYNRLKFY